MESTTEVLPFGWVRRPNGDIRDGPGPHAKFIVYYVPVAKGWMVAGVHSADELRVIAELVRV